jgi:hypothetical protein
MLEMLGEKPIWSEKKAEPYGRGTSPLTDADAAAGVDEMLAAITASHERIAAALARVSEETLDAPIEPGKTSTVGTRLVGLQFHEAYHAGQLGILRRLTGKKGAIA